MIYVAFSAYTKCFVDLYQYTKCGFVGYLSHRMSRMSKQE
ncbi:hypothetical protein mEp013_105 [Escherichia phage mEp013]